MIGRVLRVGALAVVVLGLVAACGSSNRPRELSMEDVKACELVSHHDLRQLQVRAAPQQVPGVAGVGLDGESCLYRPLTRVTVTISKVMSHGVDRWTSGSVNGAEVEKVTPIRGFPSIKVGDTVVRSGPHDQCMLYVDVADDQSLRVEVGPNSEDNPPTCDTARRFAEAAMETLASRS